MKKVFLTAALVASSSLAMADGFYAGASLGSASYDMEVIEDMNAADTSLTMEDESRGHKFTIGYSFNENLALEAYYLTDFTLDIGLKGNLPIDADGVLDMQGYGLSAVVKQPVANNVSLFGKIGFASITSNFVFAASDGRESYASEFEETDTAANFGVGAEYTFNNGIALRAEYELFHKEGDNVQFANVGVGYYF